MAKGLLHTKGRAVLGGRTDRCLQLRRRPVSWSSARRSGDRSRDAEGFEDWPGFWAGSRPADEAISLADLLAAPHVGFFTETPEWGGARRGAQESRRVAGTD
jgi:hypothetical protein